MDGPCCIQHIHLGVFTCVKEIHYAIWRVEYADSTNFRRELIRLGGDQIATGDQFVAVDGGVVVDCPLIILENLGVVLDTND